MKTLRAVLISALVVLLFSSCASYRSHLFGTATREVKMKDVPTNNGPTAGQSRRASKNFTLNPPANTIRLVWRIEGATETTKTQFNLAADLRWGPDEDINKSISNGSTTDIPQPPANAGSSFRGYYLRDVINADKPFNVQIFAVIRE